MSEGGYGLRIFISFCQLLTTNRSWLLDDMFENEIESLIEDHTHSENNLHAPHNKNIRSGPSYNIRPHKLNSLLSVTARMLF